LQLKPCCRWGVNQFVPTLHAVYFSSLCVWTSIHELSTVRCSALQRLLELAQVRPYFTCRWNRNCVCVCSGLPEDNHYLR
jgi:hypothetical protein